MVGRKEVRMGFLQKWIIGEPETVAITKQRVEPVMVEEQKILEVAVVQQVVLPPPPPPIKLSSGNLVQPFCIRSIDHSVTVDGNLYHVHVYNLRWLSSGLASWAEVIISFSGRWSVASRGRLMLTHGGNINDVVDEMIGAFAQSGLAVKRGLIDACLYPIQNQVLEIEQKLKGF